MSLLYDGFSYPINNTKYLRPTPCTNHQRNTIMPIKATPIPRVSQFLAHHNVKRRHAPRKMEAILEASKLNPHMTNMAPMAEEPR